MHLPLRCGLNAYAEIEKEQLAYLDFIGDFSKLINPSPGIMRRLSLRIAHPKPQFPEENSCDIVNGEYYSTAPSTPAPLESKPAPVPFTSSLKDLVTPEIHTSASSDTLVAEIQPEPHTPKKQRNKSRARRVLTILGLVKPPRKD